MERREFTRVLTAALAASGTAGFGCMALLAQARAAGLSESDAVAGVRVALERGAMAALALLGKTDGFLANALVRIPLPGYLHEAAKLLRAAGQGKKLDELVLAMNRAAETAVPVAKPLLVQAVKAASVEDALKVVRGGSTSVTDFFAAKTRSSLGASFLPIVTEATKRVSLAERYNAVAGKAAGLGLVKGDDIQIERYVTARALSGIYFMIGEEEKKIRADPLKTGSALLQKVFARN